MLDDHPEREHYDIGRVLSALEQGDLDLLARAAGNSFQSFTEQREHQVREAIELLKEHGACLSVMSGSGPSVFGIFEDPEAAERAAGHAAETEGNEVYNTLPVTALPEPEEL